MSDPSAGLLPHADRWSTLGLIASLACTPVLIAADLAYWYGAGGELVARQFHSMIVVGLASVAMACLVIQIGVRIIRGQRRLEAQLARITSDPGPGATTEDVDTRVVQLAGRIAGKITT